MKIYTLELNKLEPDSGIACAVDGCTRPAVHRLGVPLEGNVLIEAIGRRPANRRGLCEFHRGDRRDLDMFSDDDLDRMP